MRLAHVIVTYTPAEQTKRMIERLWHERIDFYIHLDKKFPIESHDILRDMPNVYFIQNRVDVKWAGYSTIQAILNSVEEVLNSGRQYDYINLLSGQDYPIKTPEEILQWHEKNKGINFLKYLSFDDEWLEGLLRASKYYMSDYAFKGRYLIEDLLNWILPKRTPPKNMKLFGKSMFWTLTPECLQYVLNFIKSNRDVEKFFKFSWASDEFFFQTIILNSTKDWNVVNENCQFYLHKQHEPHPKLLTIDDFDLIKASDKLYARKFDIRIDATVLDKIDKELLKL